MTAPSSYTPLSQLQQQIQDDINSGNYTGAFQTAQQQQLGMFARDPNNLGAVDTAGGVKSSGKPVNSAWAAAYGDPTNTLLSQMESSQGLHALDPSYQWTQADVNNYYAAAAAAANGANGAPMGSAASFGLGSNPYPSAPGGNISLWGDPSKFASDATTNWNAAPNSAPGIDQYAGKQPSTGSLAEKYAIPLFDAVYLGIATAGVGSGVGAALGGGLGGAIGGGAAAGAVGAAGHDAMTGAPLTLGSVGEGALGGGLTGGLAYEAAPLSGALSSAGVPAPIATGLVKGGIGAGVGALGADLSGQNVGNAALAGGASGFTSGAINNLTGSSLLGSGAGTIAGGLATKYLGSSPTQAAPSQPAPVQAPAAARTLTPTVGQQVTTQAPPAAAAAAVPGQATPTPAPANSTTSIGPYPGSSGLGYQPMTAVNPNISNYNTYGQGPEASFFAPTPGT